MKKFEVWFREDHVKVVETTACALGLSPAELVLHLAVIGMAQLNEKGRAVRALRDQILVIASLRKTGRIDTEDHIICLEEIMDLDSPNDTEWTHET